MLYMVLLAVFLVALGFITLSVNPAGPHGTPALTTSDYAAPNPRRYPLQAAAKAYAANLAFYHAQALAYHNDNPGFTGTIPEASLGLPSWYAKLGAWQSYSNGAQVVTWGAPAGSYANSNAIAAALASQQDNLPGVGYASQGNVVAPLVGVTTPIPAGAQVPDNDPVLVTPP